MKILVTTSSFGKADSMPLDFLNRFADVTLNPYGRKLTTEEFIDLSEGMDGVIAGVEHITAEALQMRPKLKVISRCGVGMDSLDTEACDRLGIKYFNTPNAPVHSVAELTITVLLNLLKKITVMDTKLKHGDWSKETGYMLEGKKVGIIGFGRIGQRVARLLSAFDAEIAYSDVRKVSDEYLFMQKEELLQWADVITIHASSCDGEYLIGQQELQRMKPTAFLVNTSRGKFIDEEALYTALQEKKLAGAALDVFSEEPYKGNLCELEQVILTPHIASSAKEGRAVMEMEAAKNVLKGLGIQYD
ncbi:MAG: hydroxyacid dehydrogenase [Schwartzia succinivorans]|nr:hydroxyacid dehydrogenase [Schwartzia succinivorans]